MLRDSADRTQPPQRSTPDGEVRVVRQRAPDASPDAELLARVATGDLHAFETLYRIYHPRLNRFLGLMTSRRSLIEEVMNDTMHVVWRRCETYNGESKVSTWIFAIAYRTALKAMRQQDEAGEESVLDDIVSDDLGPEQQYSDGQMRASLARALAGLSTEQRSVLVLTYFHDLPYAEIAQIADCPVDTVKTRMFHGRRRLRALLSGTLRDWL
jgi:RNA polymerase sigma factor (sigma-70 family)